MLGNSRHGNASLSVWSRESAGHSPDPVLKGGDKGLLGHDEAVPIDRDPDGNGDACSGSGVRDKATGRSVGVRVWLLRGERIDDEAADEQNATPHHSTTYSNHTNYIYHSTSYTSTTTSHTTTTKHRTS